LLQAYIVLAAITIVFLGLRLTDGCMLSKFEDGITTDIGREFILEDPNSVSIKNFERVAVGFSLILQLGRVTAISLGLHDIFF
jgi:hypothetical protein